MQQNLKNLEIFTADDYREAMEISFQFYKSRFPGFTKSRLAEKMRVHSSLLTNVWKSRADLTSDQLYLFSVALEHSPEEAQFLELLWAKDRTGIDEKRQNLEIQINDMRAEFISVSTQSELGAPLMTQEALAFYWTTPLAQVIVIALSVRKFSLDPELLAKELDVHETEFNRIFGLLEIYRIIQEKNSKWISNLGDYHLPKESPLSAPQNKMMRLASLNRTEKLSGEDHYQLAVTISSNLKTYYDMRKEIVAAVQKCQKAVLNTKQHSQVFQLNIDLFPWT